MKYQFEIFADYFQFYLHDDGFIPDFSNWTPESVVDLLLLAPHGIAVGTVRNTAVPLSLDVREEPPDDDFDGWDQVIECSIEITSGCIVVLGATESLDSAAHIAVVSDTYSVRIYYGGLDTLSRDGLDGRDHYKVVLWPGYLHNSMVLKRRIHAPSA